MHGLLYKVFWNYARCLLQGLPEFYMACLQGLLEFRTDVWQGLLELCTAFFTRSSGSMHDLCYKVYRNVTWLVYKVYWNSARLFYKVYWNYARPLLQGLLELCTICVTRSTGILHGLFTRFRTAFLQGLLEFCTTWFYKVFWNYARFLLQGLPELYMACLQGLLEFRTAFFTRSTLELCTAFVTRSQHSTPS
jgi:hypothetical protein